MNSDTFLTIGKTHKMCEDYILSGEINEYRQTIPYIILCDGCSSSQNTDVGARILAFSLRNTLEMLLTSVEDFVLPNYQDLGVLAIHDAKNVAKTLKLPNTALDATAIVAFAMKDKVFVYMYGDGFIVTQKRGTINEEYLTWTEYTKVSFSTGAPFYLSYHLDVGRWEAYLASAKADNDGKILNIVKGGYTNVGEMESFNFDHRLVFEFPRIPDSLIGISSDGLDSFVNIHKGEKAPIGPVVMELFAFKNTAGEFVKRRVKKAIETFAKEGIYHSDDVSIGVLRDE